MINSFQVSAAVFYSAYVVFDYAGTKGFGELSAGGIVGEFDPATAVVGYFLRQVEVVVGDGHFLVVVSDHIAVAVISIRTRATGSLGYKAFGHIAAVGYLGELPIGGVSVGQAVYPGVGAGGGL